MTNSLWLAPTYVSFYRVNVMEIGEDATNIYGFFTNTNLFTTSPAHGLHHNTADHWTPVNSNNQWEDHCAFGPYLNWASGGFEWIIPRKWQVKGSGATNSMTGYNQVFSIDSNGTARVDKYGKWVERTTNNVINHN